MSEESGSLAPNQQISPTAPRPYYEMVHVYVQDIGHEEEAYYQLGWRCISRHDRFALLCKETYDPFTVGDEGNLKFLIMEMTV
jgi:hypothetical protein